MTTKRKCIRVTILFIIWSGCVKGSWVNYSERTTDHSCPRPAGTYGHLLTRDTKDSASGDEYPQQWANLEPWTAFLRCDLMMESLLGDQVATGRHSPLRVLSDGELATCCIIPGPSVKQVLLSGCERAKLGACMMVGWVNPTHCYSGNGYCMLGCPRRKKLRPSSSEL